MQFQHWFKLPMRLAVQDPVQEENRSKVMLNVWKILKVLQILLKVLQKLMQFKPEEKLELLLNRIKQMINYQKN